YRAALLAAGILAFVSAISAPSHGADARKSVVLTLTDGHRQSFPLADISGIEFKDAAIVMFKDGHQKSFSLGEVARIEFSPLGGNRSEEHTSELQSRGHLVCRLLLEKKNTPPSHSPISDT